VTPAPQRDGRAFDFTKPWLRTDEGAAYVGYRGKHALRSFYRFLQKKGIPTARRFRVILVQRADLDRALGAGHRTLKPQMTKRSA
jgi:hypothetical protein